MQTLAQTIASVRAKWVGRVYAIPFRGRTKPMQVRIIGMDVEEDGRVWFWGRYA